MQEYQQKSPYNTSHFSTKIERSPSVQSPAKKIIIMLLVIAVVFFGFVMVGVVYEEVDYLLWDAKNLDQG